MASELLIGAAELWASPHVGRAEYLRAIALCSDGDAMTVAIQRLRFAYDRLCEASAEAWLSLPGDQRKAYQANPGITAGRAGGYFWTVRLQHTAEAQEQMDAALIAVHRVAITETGRHLPPLKTPKLR